jgi:D-alanyl-D-alanine carboxypeptidase
VHHWAVTRHPDHAPASARSSTIRPAPRARRSSARPAGAWLARLAPVLLALAVSIAGCGGSSSSGTTAGPSVAPTPTPTPTPTPQPSIYPVPTSQPEPPAAAPAAKLDDATATALQKSIDGVRSKYAIPGLSVAVVFPDGAVWAGQSGQAVTATKTAVTADTLFSVGSISKTFTGALALRLVEQGAISLDEPLSKYLPKFPNASKITIRMLMNHTSGVRDIFEASIFANFDANHSTRWTADKVLALVSRPYFAPGTNYHYSNTNYIILGQVIEKATGKTVASLVHSEFLTPLGLDHTYLQWQETPNDPLAHGYVGSKTNPTDISKGQALIPYVSEATAVGSAGGVVSNAHDIAIWATALYDGAFLDEAMMASMTDVTLTAPFKPTLLYGLALEQLPISGRLAWGHRGHLDGFWSSVAYFPDADVTVALLTNSDWINPLTAIASIIGVLPKPAS